MAWNGVYWVGANGKTYINVAGIAGGPQEWHAPLLSPQQMGLQQIADPNPPAQPPPANPTGGGGGGSAAPAKPDRTNDINLQNAGLAAVDEQERTGLSRVDQTLSSLIGNRYDPETQAAEKNYTEQSDNNTNNYQKNKQTALVNAAQGRQGLFGTLASLGALSGSGIDLANRAVQKGANDDLSGAADNYETNAGQLTTAIDTFRREDKARRAEANTSAENARLNVRNEANKARLQFLGNLANDYADMGNEAQAKEFTARASQLYPSLAKTAVPNANISYSGAAFTPGTLADYLAGQDSTVVSAAPTQPGQTIPGLFASSVNPLKRKLQPA